MGRNDPYRIRTEALKAITAFATAFFSYLHEMRDAVLGAVPSARMRNTYRQPTMGKRFEQDRSVG